MNSIILEGIDASGKTTWGNNIIRDYNYNKIIHSGKDEASSKEYFINALKSYDNCIFDRFHMSEIIFPTIYKRLPRVSFDEYEEINKYLIETNTYYIIFICSDMSIIEERLKERDELYYMKEMYAQNELFSMYANNFKKEYNYNNFYIIDVAKENAYENLNDWLKLKLKRKENKMTIIKEFTPTKVVLECDGKEKIIYAPEGCEFDCEIIEKIWENSYF